MPRPLRPLRRHTWAVCARRPGRCWAAGAAALVAALLLAPGLSEAQVSDYTGFWLNQTFGSTGNATAQINRNLPNVSFTLDLDGNVFGGTNPTPLILSGTVNPNSSVTFNPVVDHPTYG